MVGTVPSVEPTEPGNIGSYGMFGGHTNTTNRRRKTPAGPVSESLMLVLLTVTVSLCLSGAASEFAANASESEHHHSSVTVTTEAPVPNNYSGRATTGKPMFSTGNHLWDALIADCLRKPTFACIQKNVYNFLGEQLEVENMNFTNRVQFRRNRVDFAKYTREANELDADDDNEIPDDARSALFEPSSPIEEVTTALRDKSLKFMLTHDVNIQLPEILFDGAVFRVQPRAIEGNGMLAKLELVPRTELAEARGHGTPRIFFLKKIKKFFQNKLLLAFLAIVLIIKIIKIKVMWLLPLMVGVGTAKKLVLKFLLFLFPALAHIFKLCSYYHASYHKPNFHHHQHHISHLHTFYPHGPEHGGPELIYTKPPRGHPSEYLHGAPVPPHTHYQPEVNYEFTAPGLGSEFISDRNSNVETSFKPKYDDLNDIKAWGLGESTNTSAQPQSSPYFISPPGGGSGGGGSYNVNPLTHHASGSRVLSPKPVYGPPGFTSTAQKRIPTGAATSIAAQYVSAPSGPTLSAEEQIIREAQRQEAYRIAQEQKLIAKQQAIVNQQAYVQEGVTPRPVDPFYSPILQRLDKVFNSLGIVDENCRERLVCSMYKNPVKYSPHSNYVSAELSRDATELQKPTSTNAAVVRFYRYVQAARDGQDQRDCQRLYSLCTINMEKKKK
ncbi:uncharacterized protein LOC128270296 [Anopheles cruzii]|uniref:uncharacterized protein LOC128270296 n=1 Tax=Anopheles cruzii TaxID=68878 RepID=UPI0022EC41EA|nr:uncharacterized protein LOC128270296 [Anopheles cruzii]